MQKQLSLLESERRHQPQKSDGERVSDIAARLIAELDERPPVRLEVVASYRDIAEIQVVPLSTAGSLSPGRSHLVMRLRAGDSPRRRRFTGFHEVGHTFQPGYREQTLFRCASPQHSRYVANDPEALADVAAAELLLPRAYFEPATLASDFEFESVVELADEYDASIQATAYRFAHFWPEATLVTVLEMGRRRAERGDPEAEDRLRVVSAWPSLGSKWPYIPTNKSAVEGGALARAFEGEAVTEAAGLEELGLDGPERLELTARGFSYLRGNEMRRRVVALFRRRGPVGA